MKSKAQSLLFVLNEMAKLGSFGGMSFHVYHEPLKNPSFHLRIGNEAEIVVQMKDLSVLEIKFKSKRFKIKKGDKLTGDLKSIVQEFLSLKNKNQPALTNREAFDLLWKSLNN